uniref:Uncharacterized protein n=1 Tax=Anguilla anguilla TaxID=7936 RepID=A0A0E9WR79_ANGAN
MQLPKCCNMSLLISTVTCSLTLYFAAGLLLCCSSHMVQPGKQEGLRQEKA